jgi:hypothetical protein
MLIKDAINESDLRITITAIIPASRKEATVENRFQNNKLIWAGGIHSYFSLNFLRIDVFS